VRQGLTLVAGMYLVVGSEDAEPAVLVFWRSPPMAPVELEVLDGPVDQHQEPSRHVRIEGQPQ
jgi:hypothetical protein